MPRNIVEVSQFSRDDLEFIFDRADEMRALSVPDHRLAGRILATLFYEPSTRTRLSFESAMLRLGGNVISTENAREFSSAIKGESVEDTIRIVEGYADAIVIRHHEQGAAARAASVASVPVINAGDGPGEHPTQALLDLYTIRHELGRIDNLRIALVGDLRFGRAVRSLALLLTQAIGIELVFVSPPEVQMGDDVRDALTRARIPFSDESDLASAVRDVDVVYQTRIQKERFSSDAEYARNKGIYIVNAETMANLPEHAIVMHPLPRVDEIAAEFDRDPRAKYFREAHNGVYVRMSLLESLLAGPWSNERGTALHE
ncbi:MAG: aspartate carbamoyltransferase [Thermomicrobiales bacterium]|nr:aspartate carbamoyltransferase [Thermomicrobiales bacterium]